MLLERPPTLPCLLLCAGLACSCGASDDSNETVADAAPDLAVAQPEVGLDLGPVPAPDGAPDLSPTGGDGAAAPSCSGLSLPAKRDYTLTLQHGGLQRRALVHIPPSYDPDEATPLVFNNHGSMCTAELQAQMSHLDAYADKHGVITVTPQGTAMIPGWNVGKSPQDYLYAQVDDVDFFRTLIAELEKTLCIDPRRTFCTGFSLGGSMCYRLSCDMSDRIAAIASVSGPDGTVTCNPKRAVPLLHIHGTADSWASYAPDATGYNKGAEAYVAAHAKRSGCAPQTTVTLTQGKVTCKSYSCPATTEVTLCTVTDGGHTWPGGDGWLLGGTVNKDINASEMILEFFDRHPM